MKRLTYIILIINIYLLILNPYGKIAGFNIKLILFVLLFVLISICLLFDFINDRISFSREQVIAFSIACFSVYYLVFVNLFIGLAKGNRIDLIYGYLDGYILAFVIMLSFLSLGKKSDYISNLFSHFIIATTVVSIFSIAISLSYFLSPPLLEKLGKIVIEYNMGSIVPYGNLLRIFLKSHIYSLVVAFLLIIYYLKSHNKMLLLLIAINIIPPFLSLTRAFWFSFFIAIGILYISDKDIRKISIKKVLFIIISFVLGWMFFSQPLYNQRLKDSFSRFEYGNIIRAEQVIFTFEVFKENILFGMGVGGTYRDGLHSIESTYFDVLARSGVIGFFVLVIFLLYPLLFYYLKFIRNKRRLPIYYNILIGLVIFILSAYTNPYLLSSLGMLYLGICYGIILSPSNQINTNLANLKPANVHATEAQFLK